MALDLYDKADFYNYHARAIEIPITFSCNLNCKYCSHLSQYMSKVPHVPVEHIERMCTDWSERINIRYVRLIGGEPLLHPDLEKIIEICAQYWKLSKAYFCGLEIVTNGLLLPKMSPSFFELLKHYDILLRVSVYPTPRWSEIQAFLSSLESPVATFDSTTFLKYYDYVDGKPVLFQSDAAKAHALCVLFKRCHVLCDNKLYHCSVPVYWCKAQEKGIIADNRLLTYRPATIDMSPQQLQLWYDEGFNTDMCGMCRDTSLFVMNNENHIIEK